MIKLGLIIAGAKWLLIAGWNIPSWPKSQIKESLLNFVALKKKCNAMSEIKISIDDQYLQAFLAFLQTLNYVQVEKVTKGTRDRKVKPKRGSPTEAFLSALPPDSPLRQAVKPIRKGKVTAEDLVRESGYVKTDLEKLRRLAEDLDIPQSTDELLAQLTP